MKLYLTNKAPTIKMPLINVHIHIKRHNFHLVNICVIQKVFYEVNLTLKIVAGSNEPWLLGNPGGLGYEIMCQSRKRKNLPKKLVPWDLLGVPRNWAIT